MKQIRNSLYRSLAALMLACGIAAVFGTVSYAQTQQSGSVGLEGRIGAPAPTQGATISFPRDGATITDMPVTVTGICPSGLLVKLYKNNIFAGSTQCINGSFSIQIDLFNGRNELVARVYDALDQAGPDSNIVVVSHPAANIGIPDRITLVSPFATRGANPGETITWPVAVSGGAAPYAITVDWGDGKRPDIISQPLAGTFTMQHIYDSAGVRTVIVRATDKNGDVAFLQLVGVANGSVASGGGSGGSDGQSGKDGEGGSRILWQPAVLLIPLLFSSFWLGQKHQLAVLRKRFDRNGDIS